MKFGKQIQFQQIPEWQNHYMSYKGLKKIINSLIQEKAQISVTIAATPPPGSTITPATLPEDDYSRFLQSQKAEFFFKLERELEKVNSFYLQKETELKVRLRSLIDKEKIILARQGRPSTNSSINSLKEAYRQFEQDLNKLQKFVETNGTGFRKILKKWDKRSKSSTKELYLSRQIDIQPCFNQDAMVELADNAASHLLALESIQQVRPSSVPSSPIATRPSPQFHPGPVSLPAQQLMDEVETDLFSALTSNQSTVVQELLDRRLAPSTGTPGTNPVSLSGNNNHQLGRENAREIVSRVFWRCCSETSVTDGIIQLLVKSGLVDFKFVDDISDRTCLHEAAMVGRLSLLKLGVENGVSPECTDVYGRRPLHYVSMYGYADCATYLLSMNASMTATDHDGFRPLIYSVMNGHTKCVEIFLSNHVEIEPTREGDPIPLSLACHFGHEDIAMMLISRGANVRACNADGLEPLHITCREGHTRLTKTLTTRGAQLDQEDKYMCWTPLFYAASEGHVDCVKILLEVGCNVNVVDEHGKTPIYYAASEGHADCVELLVEAGGKVEGKQLGSPEDVIMETPAPLSTSSMLNSTLPSSGTEMSSVDPLDLPTNMDDLDMDLIPSLALPPPIIPFRIYGHNYLDKKFQVNITLGHPNYSDSTSEKSSARQAPVHLYGTAQISSLKLIITSRPDNGMIPHNVILPLADTRRVYGFQVNSLDQFTVDFDIFPTFGSRPIGRAVALPNTFTSSSVGRGVLPLFDAHLKTVGELAFEYSVVRPFQGVRLEVGGRLETYWKSTNSIDSTTSAATTPHVGTPSVMPVSTSTSGGVLPYPASQSTLSGSVIPSFITASSLSGEYIQLSVQMTRDFVPVVYGDWRLPVQGFDVALSDVTFGQFKKFKERMQEAISPSEDIEKVNVRLSSTWGSGEWRSRVYERWMSLEQVLKILPKHIGVNLELKYPTMSEKNNFRLTNAIEFNKFVDTILQTVYDSSSASHHRSFMFSSFNPDICSALNWKQPNYAVFFCTYAGYNRQPRARVSRWADLNLFSGLKRKEPVDLDSLPSPKHGVGADRRGPPSIASSDTVTSSPESRARSPAAMIAQSSGLSTLMTAFSGQQHPQMGQCEEENVSFHEEDKRCTSIKEAVKFARNNNLLGVICEATPLIQVPTLINNIKESGLVLLSFGMSNKDPALVQIQKNHGVDAFMFLDRSNGSGSSNNNNNQNGPFQTNKARPHEDSSATVSGVGLGLNLGSSGRTVTLMPSESSSRRTRPSSEMEEGVLRYQSGVDSGPIGI